MQVGELPERVRMAREDRAAAILECAIAQITEQGLATFGISSLARRCGLTNAGLLHHFGSKDDLMIALLDERDRRDRAAITGAQSPASRRPASREDALELLRAIVARNQAQPQLVRLNALLRAEALVPGSRAQAYFAEREAYVRAMFAELIGPFVSDAQATAQVLAATMIGLETEWLRQDGGFDLVAAWSLAAGRLIP